MTARPQPALEKIHTVAFDFDGVFTDNKVYVDAHGGETVRCDRGDGYAFDLVRAYERRGTLRAEFFILSKEANPVVVARARKLGVTCHHGIRNKLEFMTEYLRTKGKTFDGVLYVGNDLNDIPLMRKAAFAVAPADAHPRVREIADLVTEQRGGEGCVRAVIERLLGVDALSVDEITLLAGEI
jgi:3-deoxy-D-manno-octulosonate 8-phosphate phosphatase (KDO 8-P phosphatase)